MVGINASALACRGKGVGCEEIRRLYGILSSLRGHKRRIVFISSNTVTMKVNGTNLSGQPARAGGGRTLTTVNRYRLVFVCSGLFNRCGRSITRLLLAHRTIRARRGERGIVGAVSRLLEVGVVPMVGRGSAIAVSRLRNGGFNSGSVLSTVITKLITTSELVVLASVSNLCSSGPQAGPGTGGLSVVRGVGTRVFRVTTNANSGHNANNVVAGLRTTSCTAGQNIRIDIVGNSGPRGLCRMVSKGGVKAGFLPIGWSRRGCSCA